MDRKQLIYIPAALAIGGGLCFVMNLDPDLVAGVVPAGPAVRRRAAHRGLDLARPGGVGRTDRRVQQPGYFLKVMPLVAVLIVLLLQALMWVLILGAARRIVKAYEAAWTVLALPVVSVAVDTLLAHFTPDGNFGSLAYTQADVLPIAQFAALFGVGGILFLLMLVNSALALALTYGLRCAAPPSCMARRCSPSLLAVGFGWWRLQAEPRGTADVLRHRVGRRLHRRAALRAGHATSGLSTRRRCRSSRAAAPGSCCCPRRSTCWRPQMPKCASSGWRSWRATNHVWLVAGLGVDDGTQRRNEAWWFSPDGRLVTNYLKHFMAPPEREFVAGDEFPVNDIAGVRYGVAICKDMHFASLGRGFGERRARVMLVPAWDFDVGRQDGGQHDQDARHRERLRRGALVARNGLLSITDGFGRVLAVERSARLPGHHAVRHGAGAANASTLCTPHRRPARMDLRHRRGVAERAAVRRPNPRRMNA